MQKKKKKTFASTNDSAAGCPFSSKILLVGQSIHTTLAIRCTARALSVEIYLLSQCCNTQPSQVLPKTQSTMIIIHFLPTLPIRISCHSTSYLTSIPLVASFYQKPTKPPPTPIQPCRCLCFGFFEQTIYTYPFLLTLCKKKLVNTRVSEKKKPRAERGDIEESRGSKEKRGCKTKLVKTKETQGK